MGFIDKDRQGSQALGQRLMRSAQSLQITENHKTSLCKCQTNRHGMLGPTLKSKGFLEKTTLSNVARRALRLSHRIIITTTSRIKGILVRPREQSTLPF